MPNERVALVTGSTSGIGLAIAKHLLASGFKVVFHSKSSFVVGEKLANSHSNAVYIRADLSNQNEAKRLISDVIKVWGRLDVLVNNAGVTKTIAHSALKEATPEVWRELYEVNVIAPWTLIAESEEAMRKSASKDIPSCIINISSHAGVRPKGASIPYSASKASLNHITKMLAITLAPQIRVNAIAPGLVETPMSKDWVAARELWKTRSPMGRGAQPEEIAHVVLLLIHSHYLTGEILLSDGGLNLT